MTTPSGQPLVVRINQAVVEIPVGGTEPVHRPDGPAEGSTAVQGSGGGYLSNEIAHRATLLRDGYADQLPVGHIHTPVLVMDPDNTTEITDPVFERNRADIARQLEQVLRAGAATRNASGRGPS